MKIAIVSDAVYPYNKGGKEKRIYEISTRLVKLGHEVHIYCMKWFDENHRIEDGVHLHAIGPHYPLYSGERRSIRQAIMFGLSCLRLIKEDFDVVDVDHMPFFPLFTVKLVCLLKGKKMIATWAEVWGRRYWDHYLGKLGIFASFIEKLSVKLPDKIICGSKHCERRLKSILRREKNCFTIPNGVDLEVIGNIKPAQIASDIIFCGRLLKHKHVDLLLRAVKLLTGVKCIIVGDGPEKDNLIALANELKIANNVSFLGFLNDHNDVYALMKSSKVFVLPSDREGFGIAVLEANACGLPVITLNNLSNGSRDLIKEGHNGYLIKADPEELANKIDKVLIKSNFKKKIGDLHKKYQWKYVIPRILEVYKI